MNDKQQEIINEIQRVAKLLNVKSLTREEFSRNSMMSTKTVANKFGNWTRAIEAAGLIPNTHMIRRKSILTEDELLREIIRLTVELNKVPSEAEMNAFGRYSIKPYRARWGRFIEAVEIAYAKHGVPLGISVTRSLKQTLKSEVTILSPEPTQVRNVKIYAPTKRAQYGEPINFRGLRHAPLSEQGVVYMFGMVSNELGFLIEAVRTGYPDCLGKRLVNKNPQRWEDVRIEFEYKSSNFLEHGHNPEECDLIVCWLHDWTISPIEVLELRSAIENLPKE